MINEFLENKIRLLVQTFGEHRIKLNENLADHVYSKMGGPAAGFFIATNQKELIDILNAVSDLQMPFLILGNGTKTLISAQGFPGLVIKNRTSGLKVGAVKGKVGRDGIGVEEAMVEVDSGVSLGKLNEFLISQKLQTLENDSNLATVGGSIWINQALIEASQKVTVWQKGEILEVGVQELKRSEDIILSLVLKVPAKKAIL